MSKFYTKAKPIDWDVLYYTDMSRGNGFVIDEPAIISFDNTKKKTMYGAQSPLYGTTYDDEDAFIERYRCECTEGGLKGKLYEGEICPKCGKKVKYKGIDIKITGWIILHGAKCINPYYYQMLLKLVGKKVLPDIINGKLKIDIDGNTSIPDPTEIEKEPSSPFVGIGVDEFRENFKDIMLYFKAKKGKKKAAEFDKIIKNKSAVFTSHIPIYSTMLRPQSFTADTFYYNSIDKQINTVYNLSDKLVDCNPVERPLILYRIQKRVNKMWEYNFDLITKKEGFIRDKLLGGSINYSARNVIIPEPSLMDNQVDMSYQTFRTLFKDRIIYYLQKMLDIYLSEAIAIWNKSFKFDPQVYEIMNYILLKDEPKILINRNPTLNYYSMLLMDIRSVKPDDKDYCLSIPLGILNGMNADFDGDILNIFVVTIPEMKKIFRKFNPIERMIISRDTGEINSLFELEKSQLIDLYYYMTL